MARTTYHLTLPPTDVTPIFQGQAQRWLSASPATVYALISDLTRMGEYSPECFRVEWLAGSPGPAVGARARGWSRFSGITWSRIVEVIVAEPEREFTFQTVPELPLYQDSTVWRYTMAPSEGGTLLTESYTMVLLSPMMHAFEIVTGRPKKMVGWMEQTLERIKHVAERARDAEVRAPE